MFKKHVKKVMFIGDGHLKGFSEYFSNLYPNLRFEESIKETNTLYDLNQRIKTDVIKAKPDIVFLSIGTNDVLENKNTIYLGTTSSMERFDDLYRDLMNKFYKAGIEDVVLVEPFYVSSYRMNDSVRYDVNDKIYVTRKVASDYGAKIVASDGVLNQTWINSGSMGVVGMSGMKLKSKGRQALQDACEALIKKWSVK